MKKICNEQQPQQKFWQQFVNSFYGGAGDNNILLCCDIRTVLYVCDFETIRDETTISILLHSKGLVLFFVAREREREKACVYV
mmetsp:Transcript_15910/g.17174  ORF Transcript_15910/g.17174 Transcript_15910/m.17174 type:complete len:83 (+) Transcript_15910:189-437(+)